MGKALLLLVIGFGLFGGMMIFSGPTADAMRSEERLAEVGAELLAREIAMAAYNVAQQKVLSGEASSGHTEFDGSYQGGTFTVDIQATSGDIGVQVEGRHPFRRVGGGDAEAVHTINATFSEGAGGGSTSSVPGFMKYALITNQEMTFNGKCRVWPPNYPNGHVANANIHANTRLTINGNSDIRGFGTFSQPLSDPGILSRSAAKFNPPFSATGDGPYDAEVDPSSYHYKEHVDVPTFDAAAYRDAASEVHLYGNKMYERETIAGGTRDNPRIIYIQNELQIKNKVRIEGYVLFVVRGNIVINGGFDNVYNDGAESNVAFYTSSSLMFNGSSDLEGQILAHNVVWNGSGNLYGSIATQGHLHFNGNRNVYYRPASPALTNPIWGGEETVLRLADYREWSDVAP